VKWRYRQNPMESSGGPGSCRAAIIAIEVLAFAADQGKRSGISPMEPIWTTAPFALVAAYRRSSVVPAASRATGFAFNLDGRPRGKAAPANLHPDLEAEVWGVLDRVTRRDCCALTRRKEGRSTGTRVPAMPRSRPKIEMVGRSRP
jgi:hypothetical protein